MPRTMKNPVHPGQIIRADIIEPLGLTVSEAANVLHVRRATLSDVLNGKASLSAKLALKIEKAFGPRAEHLVAMQCAYDIAQTRRTAAAEVAKVRRYRKAA